MNTTDKKILRLIDLLIFQQRVSSIRNFCQEVDILEQTVSKTKKGINHFTVAHIEVICKTYNVNVNWVYGFENKVFRTKDSIEITDI